MASAIGANPAAMPASDAGAKRAVWEGFSRSELIVFGILIASFVGVYFRWIDRQLGPGGWSASKLEDWGHSYIVPFISIYFVWKQRERIFGQPKAVFWPGASALALGIVCYAYFLIGFSNHMFQGAAMLLAIGGLVAMLVGPRVLRSLVMPIGYLAFGVTISEMVMNKITWGLKLLASQGSEALLTMVGLDVDRAGNVLTVFANGEEHALNVAEACSGMRMVIAFFALAGAVAMFGCKNWWQRIAVILLALPVALGMNIVRVAVLGLATLIDPELATGDAHMLIGMVLLVPSFMLFMGCVYALNRVVQEPGEEGES
ncbi:MAG: exosortase/archaeosortase family protein [Planctomycetota bacterium]